MRMVESYWAEFLKIAQTLIHKRYPLRGGRDFASIFTSIRLEDI